MHGNIKSPVSYESMGLCFAENCTAVSALNRQAIGMLFIVLKCISGSVAAVVLPYSRSGHIISSHEYPKSNGQCG